MISIIWPYWDRQEVADYSARLMADHYRGMDIEIVVVDDGNRIPYKKPDVDIPINVFRLPVKDQPLNPCVPINYGVENANGDVIVLTNPEILHRRPLLKDMIEELGYDKNKYVQAAVYHVKNNGNKVWHSHSSVAGKIESNIAMPKNACFHFLSMLYVDLFDRAGGFDNDYRSGAGYDDPDFVLRLEKAGAQFVMRDDLQAEHMRFNAHAPRTIDEFALNESIFRRKWS